MSTPPATSGHDSHMDYRPLAEREAAARALKSKRMRTGGIIVGVIVLSIFLMAWNPPTGSVHSFTKTSDYNTEKDSGCVNSGEGCHGQETAYADFNDYHPNAVCTSCHEYQGVGCIPCHSPANHECAACHDGSMKNAPDRTRITDPYPRGHYRETTHTATGTDMDRVMVAADGGEAKAACKDCHDRDLRDSHKGVPKAKGTKYGTDIGCGECHNDKRAFGLAQVDEGWKDRECEDCHREGSSSKIHSVSIASSAAATGKLSCGTTGPGCHANNDIHAVHPDAPVNCSGSAKDGEPGCHDLDKQADKPEAIACGLGQEGCHAFYVNEDYSHSQDATVHAPTADAALGTYEGIACASCHDVTADGMSLVNEHDLATSQESHDDNPCTNCHADAASLEAILTSWEARDSAGACDACHGTGELDAAHSADSDANHLAQNSAGCAVSGIGCHRTANLRAVGELSDGVSLHTTCLRCHDREAAGVNRSFDPDANSCGSGRECHSGSGDYNPKTSVHDGAVRVDGNDAKHTASASQRAARGTDTFSGVRFECGDCHSFRLANEHARPNSSIATGAGTICARCHNDSAAVASVVKTSWPERTCVNCHTIDGVGRPHENIDGVHKATELTKNGIAAPGTCSQGKCHGTTDVRKLHAAVGCIPSGCHSSANNIFSSSKMSCGGTSESGSCHSNIATGHAFVHANASGTQSMGCTTCHGTDLPTVHQALSCVCHSATYLSTKMELLTAAGKAECVDCHSGAYTPHVGVHAPLETSLAANSTACVACHGSNILNVMTPGTSLVATAVPGPGEHLGCLCHTYREATPDKKACEDCHEGTYAPHGFETPTVSGHNTTAFGIIGARTRFDGSQGVVLKWVSEIASASLNATWLVEPGFQAATRPTGINSVAVGQEGTVTTRWEFPSVNVFWKSGDASAPADAMFLDKDYVVTCQACHANLNAAGPHGSSDNWALDPDYPGDYSKGELTKNIASYPSGIKLRSNFNTGTVPYTSGMTMICSKCHDLQNYQSGTTKNNPLPYISTGQYTSFVHDGDTFTPWRGTLPGGTSAGWYVFTDADGHPSTVGIGQSWSVSTTGTAQSATVGSSNTAHSSYHQDRTDGSPQCVNCHIGVPHGWKAPRLLVNTGIGAFTGVFEHAVVGDAAPYLDPDRLGVTRGNITTGTPGVFTVPWYKYDAANAVWVSNGTTTEDDWYISNGSVTWRSYGWNRVGMLSLSAVDNHTLNAGSVMPGNASLPAGMDYDTGAAYWSEPSCQACNDHMGEDGIRIIGTDEGSQ